MRFNCKLDSIGNGRKLPLDDDEASERASEVDRVNPARRVCYFLMEITATGEINSISYPYAREKETGNRCVCMYMCVWSGDIDRGIVGAIVVKRVETRPCDVTSLYRERLTIITFFPLPPSSLPPSLSVG